MENLLLFATFIVAFLSSILSGMAGSGGSFIMGPYWLVSGLTPAQGATTGAFMALGLGAGSLAAFKGSDDMPRDKKLVIGLLSITALTSAIGPFFLHQFSTATFKPILIAITVLSLPLLFIPRRYIRLGKHSRMFGWILMTITLLVSSFVSSSAFSILTAVLLLQIFNFSILQSTFIRRMIGIIQSIVIFVVLVGLGDFLWQPAIAGIIGGGLGSFIGTRIAIKRGEKFAKYALAFGAILGCLALIVW